MSVRSPTPKINKGPPDVGADEVAEVAELADEETVGRDVADEIRLLIIAETSTGEFRAVEVAERIVAKLRATDPDLLLAYLEEHAVRAFTDAILILDRQRKSRLRSPRKTARSVFAHAANQHEGGDSSGLESWLETWVEAGPGNVKVHLRDAKREHLDFAIGRYQRRAQSNAFEAFFLEAIRNKIGSDRVQDHFTDEQIAELRATLTSS